MNGQRILILGLGGAGCNTLTRIAARAPEGMEFAAVDCDFQTLETCSAVETKVGIGKAVTGGLSAGGDPETGRRCAESASERLETLFSGVDLLIVIAGLGGGFSSGAAPVVARLARNFGSATLFFTILPFPCEGVESGNRARTAIRRLRTYADTIVQMPNEQLQPDGGQLLSESLAQSDRILAAGTIGLWRLLAHTGVCNLDFSALHTMLNSCDGFSRFVCASAEGEDRAEKLVEALKSHPLAEDGTFLSKAPGMIVGLTGGDDLKLNEIQTVLDQLRPDQEECWFKSGIAIDPAFSGRIAAVVLAAKAWSEPLADDGRGGLKAVSGEKGQGELTGILKPRSRAFGGVERTVWNGEDLDVPTYIRRKIKLPR